ncbi:MAG: hypothetical protein WCC69_11065 [Pirellulales bacterium]
MGHVMFYLAVIAACLLWSAAFVAAAARTERPRLRRLLAAVAVIIPPLALGPWVGLTGVLAFGAKLTTNWFLPTLFAFVSAIVGGLWIRSAGLIPAVSGRPFAATWPAVGLAAMFVMAKAIAFGTLLFIDNAVAAKGRALRVEAAQLMQANLPLATAPDGDAAPLYLRAFEAIAADPSLGGKDSPLSQPVTADVTSPRVTELLARHAATLELLRQATDRPGCRFQRDWTRPSISMVLPEVQEMRQAARLLALAARRAMADGDAAAALRDVVRIHRVGIHASGEPILICGLVGQAIDTLALQTLAGVLPRLEQQDLPLLDQPAVSDFLGTPLSYQRHFLGEEAFGLATFGDLADGRHGIYNLVLLNALGDRSGSSASEWFLAEPVSFLYRCFLLPADLAVYRAHMEGHQRFIARSVTGRSPSEFATQRGEVADESSLRRAGLITSAMAPALANALQSEMKGRALHRAAEVLVAATRARLAGGTLPDTVDALVPGRLPVVPRDPFADGKPLIARRVGSVWSVYSVGPDGEDDGGPPAAGVQPPEGNDDVGLRMQVSAGTPFDAP